MNNLFGVPLWKGKTIDDHNVFVWHRTRTGAFLYCQEKISNNWSFHWWRVADFPPQQFFKDFPEDFEDYVKSTFPDVELIIARQILDYMLEQKDGIDKKSEIRALEKLLKSLKSVSHG